MENIEIENYSVKYKKIIVSNDHGIKEFKVVDIKPYEPYKTCVEIFYEYIDKKGVLRKGSSIQDERVLTRKSFMKDIFDSVAICEQIWEKWEINEKLEAEKNKDKGRGR